MARHFHAVIALLAALAPLAQCHMVIIKAQGDVSGSNASIAFGGTYGTSGLAASSLTQGVLTVLTLS